MSCENIQNQWKAHEDKYPLSTKLPLFCNKKERQKCGNCPNEVLTVENAGSKHSRDGGRRRRRRKSRRKSKRKSTKKKRRRRRRKSTKKKKRRRRRK